jgi:two-component sensor histidine kinase
MLNTIHQKYKEALEAISFLQDILYNTKKTERESQQEQLVRQGNDLIQEAFELYEGTHEETQRITELQALQHRTAELETSLQDARHDARTSKTRLQEEKADHQQTRENLGKAKTRLQKEITHYEQTEKHMKHLEQLLQQEITHHERTKAQVDADELLIKEIHHRVKNNMTMAISFIGLQMGHIHCQEDLILFQELEHRIYTMALIHEKLYKSQDASSINFQTFIDDLTHTLLSAYVLYPDQITLRLEVEDVFLKLDKAIPCGLIVNELLTNVLKYAFPDGRQGTVSITGQRQQETYVLTIRDDGVGLPEDFDSNGLTTLGMRLVTLLAQIIGKVSIDRTQGTAFIIEFSMDVMK